MHAAVKMVGSLEVISQDKIGYLACLRHKIQQYEYFAIAIH